MTPIQRTMQVRPARSFAVLCLLSVVFAATNYAQESARRGSNAGSASGDAAHANAAPLPAPYSGPLHVAHVQGKVYMIAGAGGNITVQAGDDGVLLVDTGVAANSDQVSRPSARSPKSPSATSLTRTSIRTTSAATKRSPSRA